MCLREQKRNMPQKNQKRERERDVQCEEKKLAKREKRPACLDRSGRARRQKRIHRNSRLQQNANISARVVLWYTRLSFKLRDSFVLFLSYMRDSPLPRDAFITMNAAQGFFTMGSSSLYAKPAKMQSVQSNRILQSWQSQFWMSTISHERLRRMLNST